VYRAGRLTVEGHPAAVVTPPLAADLATIRTELGLAVPEALLAQGALVWTSLFGSISFEVFGQYGADTFAASDDLFNHHLALLAGWRAASSSPPRRSFFILCPLPAALDRLQLRPPVRAWRFQKGSVHV
jgi:hypothetical protein